MRSCKPPLNPDGVLLAGFQGAIVRVTSRVAFRPECCNATNGEDLGDHQVGNANAHARPAPPGAFFRCRCLELLRLTVTEAAKTFAVSRNSLSLRLAGRLGIAAEMAFRMSAAFGGSSDCWLTRQLQDNFWHAREGRESVSDREFVAA